jgi:hypothetical protein
MQEWHYAVSGKQTPSHHEVIFLLSIRVHLAAKTISGVEGNKLGPAST